MKVKIALLTGNELRHKFFASFLSSYPKIDLKLVVHERNNKLTTNPLYLKSKKIKSHVDLRKKTEIFFFNKFVKKNNNYKFINVQKSKINDLRIAQKIKKEKIDFLISYGCSIINFKILNLFLPNFLNIHLGLSPYYKGAGTNFFPFVNKQLHFCGSTIMQTSEKLDGGKILHQLRPNFVEEDNIHTIGNKIIQQTAIDLCKILTSNKKIKFYELKTNFRTKIYKQKDFDEKSLNKALKNLNNNLVKKYIINKKKLDNKYPIISQL